MSVVCASNRPFDAEAGVADHDVQPAALVEDARDERPHLLLVGHVGRQGQRPPPGSGNLAGQRVQPIAAPRGQHDRHPRARERHGRGAPDAGGSARDDGHAARKEVRHDGRWNDE